MKISRGRITAGLLIALGASSLVVGAPVAAAPLTGSVPVVTTATLDDDLGIAGRYSSGGYGYFSNYASIECSELKATSSNRLQLISACNSKLTRTVFNSTTLAQVSKHTANLPADAQIGAVQQHGDHIYVLLGWENMEQVDSKVVYQVNKYSADLKLVGSASIRSGAITSDGSGALSGRVTLPFRAGSPDMTLQGNNLVIYLGRQMYRAGDGLNHQKNLALQVNTNTMASLTERTLGWVSHSFNQFIEPHGNALVTLDHGDAYPRSAVLGYWGTQDSWTVDVAEYHGEIGANFTGATVNDLQIDGSTALIVGASHPHSNAVRGITGSNYTMLRNIYFATVNLSNKSVKHTWITTTDPNSTAYSFGDPSLVKVSANRYAVLFENQNTATGSRTLEYRLVDLNGKIVASKSFPGTTFDPSTQPILTGGRLVWTGKDLDQKSRFFVLDVSNPSSPSLGTTNLVEQGSAHGVAQIVPSADLTGDGYGDVIVIDGNGGFWIHRGAADGSLSAGTRLASSGWKNLTVYAPGDFNGDGHADVLAKNAVGDLYFYPGRGNGSLGSGVRVGWEWGDLEIFPAGDVTGDGAADLLAINPKGELFYYAGNGSGGFTGKLTRNGQGWQGFDLYPAGDINGDGRADILSIDRTGRLYTHLGKGGGMFRKSYQSGQGWFGFDLYAGADINRDNYADLFSRDDSGKLYFYAGRAGGGFRAKVQVGTGWD